jgi:hypothetical protein
VSKIPYKILENIEYTIATGRNVNELCKQVRYMIEKGFEPLGGVAAHSSLLDGTLLQTMVRRSPKEHPCT